MGFIDDAGMPSLVPALSSVLAAAVVVGVAEMSLVDDNEVATDVWPVVMVAAEVL